MNHLTLITTLGLTTFFLSSLARAELPSLLPDTAPSAKRASAESRYQVSLPGKFEKFKQGTLNLNFASVDYRFADNGLRAGFQAGRASTHAVIGYDGEHRLELDWRLQRTNLKFAVTAADRSSGYRVELVHTF